MNIVKSLLPINGFSRTGKVRPATLGIIMHYIGVAGQSAKNVQGYFAGLATQDALDNKPDVSASAHYIIDQDGTILQCMPEEERAYHCGTSRKDPISGFIYTEKARVKFGKYAAFPDKASPNSCTIGIEMCHGKDGVFTAATIGAATALCADICKRYKLTEQDILTHNEVVGWKECPLLWTKRPAFFIAFKEDVRRAIHA